MKYPPIQNPSGVTQAELAKRCGVAATMISQVLRGVKRPIFLCLRLEKHTGGKLSRQMLRPDVDWEELQDLICTKPAKRR